MGRIKSGANAEVRERERRRGAEAEGTCTWLSYAGCRSSILERESPGVVAEGARSGGKTLENSGSQQVSIGLLLASGNRSADLQLF